jgi:hypothetical protein
METFINIKRLVWLQVENKNMKEWKINTVTIKQITVSEIFISETYFHITLYFQKTLLYQRILYFYNKF